jgi:hypothetical protein
MPEILLLVCSRHTIRQVMLSLLTLLIFSARDGSVLLTDT